MNIDVNKEYRAKIETTEGDIITLLHTKKVPQTVNNFIFLAKDGFYNEIIFHRVIENFMIQSGDPTATGSGGPGYSFPDEAFSGKYTKGTLAMANSGPHTNGSQFFIMHSDVDLPLNYVIFGEVVEGFDVLDAIATVPTKPNMFGENSTPKNPVTIKSIQIL
ncbi:MAG: peptidylprolyl isomerase [Candidatus Moranbacteria bacterium]|nr:peptidylprolyl isomerase [Candidatus Moranbacteria bacterium]